MIRVKGHSLFILCDHLSDFHNMYFVSIVLYDPDQILCFQPYCSRVIIRMYTNQTGTLFECLINIEYNFLLRIIEQAKRRYRSWYQATAIPADGDSFW